MSSEDDVRKASKQFYAALNRMANGDASAMAGAWSHGKHATTMHPIGGRDIGWDAIKASFGEVASLASKGNIEMKDQIVRVVGDVAYELGVERGEITMGGHRADIEHRVTNIYEREGGAWKLVHHHTDTSPPMLDILARLQPAAE
jgi:ketosteroid isomerase-like protein